jgi:hypothetical protein
MVGSLRGHTQMPLPFYTPASISMLPFHGALAWMDGLCNGQLRGMDGNGCTGHPFPFRGCVDRGRGMDRQPGYYFTGTEEAMYNGLGKPASVLL